MAGIIRALKFGPLAGLALAVLLAVLLPMPAHSKKKRPSIADKGEASNGCRACERMVIAMEKVSIPAFKDSLVSDLRSSFFIVVCLPSCTDGSPFCKD